MAIYIDPPLWPAHHTLWSHLVSDTSYDELHQFAARLGLPRRSFDLDHYDVPASMHARAEFEGAHAIGTRELVHRLRDSGLRIKQVAREAARPIARADFLHEEWSRLFRMVDAGARGPRGDSRGESPSDSWERLGSELLVRWAEPHRSYHDVRHLEDVLLALDHLRTRGESVEPATLLAAWYHDAVYAGRPDDEAQSARLASSSLADLGLPPSFTQQVADLIAATAPGSTPPSHDHSFSPLLDADVSIFAAAPSRYNEYSAAVRNEYAHVAPVDFRAGRSRILHTYLAKPTVYRSVIAQEMWEERARVNLTREVGELESGSSPTS